MYDRRQQEMEEEYFSHQDYIREAYGSYEDHCFRDEEELFIGPLEEVKPFIGPLIVDEIPF
jgi:hypothetical protein